MLAGEIPGRPAVRKLNIFKITVKEYIDFQISYIGFPEWVEVQVENVLSKVLPAGVELGGDEPDAVRAQTLVVNTELHSLTLSRPQDNPRPGRSEETENNSGHSKHYLS